MSLLSKGGDWEAHPQGLWTGTLVEVKETSDSYGPKIRWFFETNCRNEEDKPRRVSMKSSYRGLGNEKAWLEKILRGFGFDTADPYWTSFDDLGGFQFIIDEGHKIGLEIKHYDKSDGTKGDNIADVMTVAELEDRKAQLRASLDADGGSARRPAAPNGNGQAPRPSAPGRPALQRQAPVAAGGGYAQAPPDDYVPEDDPFKDEG